MEEGQNNVNMGGGESGGSAGPVISVIVILAIIILGGLYFWNQRGATDNGAALDDINTQSESDDTTSIEADLESTDIENLDAEINAS
ncbi:MAG: hypothetical protein Q8P21_01355 [bacterium]|nr:hypothetical protein [bacterium]